MKCRTFACWFWKVEHTISQLQVTRTCSFLNTMFNPSDYMCTGKRPHHRRAMGINNNNNNGPTVDEKTPLLVTSQPGKMSSKRMKQAPYYGAEMLYPEMMGQASVAYRRKTPRLMKQSRSGWADSDSEEEYRRDPSKRPEDSTLQSYLVIAMVMAILAMLAAIKGYNIYHGTEEREENRPKGGYY